MSNRVECLLAEATDARRLPAHFDHFVLEALLHYVPHEGHVLLAADEDVAVVASHHPIMLLPGPTIGNLRDA